MNLTIRFEGNAAKVLRAAAKRMSDMHPMMGEIAAEMHEQTRERFATETAPSGVPWKKSARAIADGKKTLRDKGFLHDAVKSDATATEAIVGVEVTASAAAYARIHQFGFSGSVQVPAHQRTMRHVFGRRLSAPITVNVQGFNRTMNMPARPYLGFGEDDKTSIEQILSKHLNRAFEGGAA